MTTGADIVNSVSKYLDDQELGYEFTHWTEEELFVHVNAWRFRLYGDAEMRTFDALHFCCFHAALHVLKQVLCPVLDSLATLCHLFLGLLDGGGGGL